MKNKLPQAVEGLRETYPGVWKSCQDLGEQCHCAGPLDERVRRLVKVGIAAAAQSEGAVHSAVRHAQTAGGSPKEIRHAILLTITTIGFPRAIAYPEALASLRVYLGAGA